MTRDEAEETLREKTANGCSLSDIRNFLDMATALGMLDLDELTSVRDRACFAIWNGTFLAALDKAGLKIVEK